jgi:small subunit ribosomal protein S6
MNLSANLYECMVLLDSAKYNADAAGVVDAIHAILARHKAEIVVSRPWDERRLLYPIEGHKKGTYFLIYFRAGGAALEPIRADFALNETVLRSLILKVHPKLAEALLTVARDEHAGVALQAAGLAEDELATSAK